MDALRFERAVEDVIAALERWHLPEPHCRLIVMCVLEDVTLNNLMTLKDVLTFEIECVEPLRHVIASNAVVALERIIKAEMRPTPAWRALRVAMDAVLEQRAYHVRWPTTAQDHEMLSRENESTGLGIVYAGFVERAELDVGLLQRLRDTSAAFVASTLPADGPVEPDGFRHEGNEISGIPNMEFLIASLAARKATISDGIKALWPTGPKPYEPRKQIEVKKSNLNKRLRSLGIEVSVRNGVFTIIRARNKPARKPVTKRRHKKK